METKIEPKLGKLHDAPRLHVWGKEIKTKRGRDIVKTRVPNATHGNREVWICERCGMVNRVNRAAWVSTYTDARGLKIPFNHTRRSIEEFAECRG